MFWVCTGLGLWVPLGIACVLIEAFDPALTVDQRQFFDFDLYFVCAMALLCVLPTLMVVRFKGRILRLFSRWSDAMQRDRDGAFLAQLIAAQSDRSSHDDNDPFASAGSDGLRERGSSMKVLRARGHEKLRCVQWVNLTLDLFADPHPASGNLVDTRDSWQNYLDGEGDGGDKYDEQVLRAERYYSRSEACRPGTIDFFISHSPKDDPVAKYAQLEQLVAIFTQQHGR